MIPKSADSLFKLEDAPLEGVYLLEANAGTGKTFSLTGLFLKFLYFEETFSLKQIAAITYTKAATQEIYSRIRKDLEDFLMILERPSFSDDLELEKLSYGYLVKDYYSLSPLKQQAKRDHLEKNLYNFDEHNIHTIHGFAGKIISEYRFELGLRVGDNIIPDDGDFFEKGFRGFWREQLLDVDPFFLAYFESNYFPSKWRKILDTLYRQPSLITYPLSPADPVTRWEQSPVRGGELLPEMNDLKAAWREVCGWVPSQVDEVAADLNQLFNGGKLKLNMTKGILMKWSGLTKYFQMGKLIPFLYGYFKDPELLNRFTSKFYSYFKKDFPAEENITAGLRKVIEDLDQLNSVLEKLQTQYRDFAFLLFHASDHFIKTRSRQEKESAGAIGFNDLLEILLNHLQSSKGKGLIDQVTKVFRVILIDEFQDTDPLQCRIFKYLIPGLQSVYFIADPKQSIYGFRQANIHTYFQARQSMDKVFYLLANYRSEPLLLEGINHIYGLSPSPFFIEQLPYHPSVPGLTEVGSEGELKSIKPNKPIQLRMGRPGKYSAENKRQQSARLFVQDLQAELGRSDNSDFPRMAVLVRKRKQAILIQSLLRSHGIPSLMEGNESVFDTKEARDLYLLVQAIADCDEDSPRPITSSTDPRLKGALATRFFQENDDPSLPIDEESRVQYLLYFREAIKDWRERGWYPMIHRLIRAFHIPARLLAQQEGDERYANLSFLIDLIHSWENSGGGASQEIGHSPVSLLRHYRRCLQKKPTFTSPALNSESKDRVIKIVTVHKSKGLEYDIVFIPFGDQDLFSGPQKIIFKPSPEEISSLEAEGDGVLAYDLGSDQLEKHKTLSEQETLAEELRLCYVALTRAKKRLYLYLTPDPKVYRKSVLAYLLHPPDDESDNESDLNLIWTKIKSKIDFGKCLEDWREDLRKWGEHPAIEFLEVDDTIATIDMAEPSPTELPPFRSFSPAAGKVYCNSFMTSFSSLTRDIPRTGESVSPGRSNGNPLEEISGSSPGDPIDEKMDDLGEEVDPGVAEREPADQTFHDPLSAFPPGTAVGLFLHEVLEKLEFDRADPNYHAKVFFPIGQKFFGNDFRSHFFSETLNSLNKMVENIRELFLSFPDDVPIRLGDILSSDDVVKELEFTLHFRGRLEEFREALFSRLNERGLIDGSATQSAPQSIHRGLEVAKRGEGIIFQDGFIKGFVDLVFRRGERYYLIDWKSNFLGNDIRSYQEDHLHQVMVRENYYLQAHIYSLALDRYLSLYLGNSYDYQKHFGGYAYVFVRGIEFGGLITGKPDNDLISMLRRCLSGTAV